MPVKKLEKKCPEDKEVSKKTGNCVKKCTEDQKRNPKTGRCRKINPKATKPQAAKTQVAKPQSKTPTTLTLPPISLNLLGRKKFVDKDSEKEKKCGIDNYDLDLVARVLTINMKKNLGISVNLRKATTNFDACVAIQNAFPSPIVLPGWKITKLLGNGSFGVAFGTRGPNNEAGALKIMKENKIDLVDGEIKMGKKFHKLGLSPSVTKVKTFKMGQNSFHSIHMDRLDGILGSYLASNPSKKIIKMIIDKTLRVVKKLSDNNIVHGDLHFENIGYIHSREKGEVGKLQVIDHGFATSGISLPELDLLQMLRSSQFMWGIKKDNANFIDKTILDEAKKQFGISLPTDIYEQDRRMDVLRRKIGRRF